MDPNVGDAGTDLGEGTGMSTLSHQTRSPGSGSSNVPLSSFTSRKRRTQRSLSQDIPSCLGGIASGACGEAMRFVCGNGDLCCKRALCGSKMKRIKKTITSRRETLKEHDPGERTKRELPASWCQHALVLPMAPAGIHKDQYG